MVTLYDAHIPKLNTWAKTKNICYELINIGLHLNRSKGHHVLTLQQLWTGYKVRETNKIHTFANSPSKLSISFCWALAFPIIVGI